MNFCLGEMAENEVKSEPLADSPTSVLEDEVYNHSTFFTAFVFLYIGEMHTFSLAFFSGDMLVRLIIFVLCSFLLFFWGRGG